MRHIIIFLLLISLLSCDKYRAKKYSGTYYCIVKTHHYSMYSSPEDSTYMADLIVTQDSKSIKVFGISIHVDLLKEDGYYTVNTSSTSYYKIRFIDDKIYFSYSSGGLGSGGGASYSGTKLK